MVLFAGALFGVGIAIVVNILFGNIQWLHLKLKEEYYLEISTKKKDFIIGFFGIGILPILILAIINSNTYYMFFGMFLLFISIVLFCIYLIFPIYILVFTKRKWILFGILSSWLCILIVIMFIILIANPDKI